LASERVRKRKRETNFSIGQENNNQYKKPIKLCGKRIIELNIHWKVIYHRAIKKRYFFTHMSIYFYIFANIIKITQINTSLIKELYEVANLCFAQKKPLTYCIVIVSERVSGDRLTNLIS
jgi:hypothetical protein